VAGPGEERVYSKRVGEQSQLFAHEQESDLVRALSESRRLSYSLYDQAKSGASDKDLVGSLLEWWSANVHFAARLAANYWAFVGGLGADLEIGATDTVKPLRRLSLDSQVTAPTVLGCWKIGQGLLPATRLPQGAVTFTKKVSGTAQSTWEVQFDLSGDPPGAQKSGTYFLEFSTGFPTALSISREYFYLDPQPQGS
jgi:hypothetical protein